MDEFTKPVSIWALKNFSALVHGFSQRNFISSEGEKKELLLGKYDDENCSLQHRQWFLQSLCIKNTEQIFLLKQTHSDRVYVLEDADKAEADVAGEEADALITHLTNRPIGVLTADCIPIIIYDPVLHVTGAVHAGRKGTHP